MTAEYLAAVERALLEGTGRGLMLSAMDLQYVKQWARAGVPAAVVVAGIQKAFEGAPRTTRGLAYAAPAVERSIKAWIERRVGGPTLDEAGGGDAEVVESLDRLMARLTDAGLRLQPPVRFVLRDAFKAIRTLKQRCAAGIESDAVAALERVNVETAEALWAITPAAEQAEIDARIGAVDTATRAAQRWKALRARHRLPALALEIGGGW